MERAQTEIPGETQQRDGRVRRGERSRERILAALVELVRAGELRPTAEQVARRARVAERTVFRHFLDMESLHAGMSERVAAEARALVREPEPTDGLEERVREAVHTRARVFEIVMPFKHAERLYRPFSDVLERNQARANRELRAWLERAFRRELDGTAPQLLEALDLLTCFEAWDRLRNEQRLGVARARAVMESAVLALLASAEQPEGS